MNISVWTLTVDDPNGEINTTVHADELGVKDEIAGLWAHVFYPDLGNRGQMVQQLTAWGYTIYIEQHELNIELEVV